MKGIANPDFILVFVAAGVGVVLLAGLIRYFRRRRFCRDRMEEQEPEEIDQTTGSEKNAE